MRIFRKGQAVLLTAAMIFTSIPVQAETPDTSVFGDFKVTTESGSFSAEDNRIVINGNGTYTIEMKDGVEQTDDSIFVVDGTKATLILKNLDIDADDEAGIFIYDSEVELVFPKNTETTVKSESNAAIYVASNAKLTISGEGTVNAEVGVANVNAGIGSSLKYSDDVAGEIVINGATVNVKASFGAAIGGCADGNGGKLTVNKGTVNVSSDFGTGIGAGIGEQNEKTGSGGTITINGGVVNVECENSTGIGGGWSENTDGGDGADLTVNGGELKVQVKGTATAIGGGWSSGGKGGNGGTFTLNDGTVTVTSVVGPAIGGGVSLSHGGDGCDITVNGGTLNASTVSGYTAIGGGLADSKSGGTEIGGDGGSLKITGGTVMVKNGADVEGCGAIGGGYAKQRGKNTVLTIQPKAGMQIDAVYDYENYTPEPVEGSPFTSGSHMIEPLQDRNSFKATTSEKAPAENSDVDIEGYQISATYGGVRTISSVPKTVDGKQVVGRGIIYAIATVGGKDTGVKDSDMKIHTKHPYARDYDMSDRPTLTLNGSDPNKTYFGAIMLFANGGSKKEFEATYKIRAYAILEDGSIAYSDIENYSIYRISHSLYQNQKMSHKEWHIYLYEKILKVVNPDYEEVDYDWNNDIISF